MQGRIERVQSSDALRLYVFGNVDETPVDLSGDGSFSVDVDMFEPSRAILYWDGRAAEEWSFVVWLQPDSLSRVQLSVQKDKSVLTPGIRYEGACADVSNLSNLLFQLFERQNVFDAEHLSTFTNFAACQAYVEKTLQPLGEAWLNVGAGDGNDALRYDNDDDDDDGDGDDDPSTSSGQAHDDDAPSVFNPFGCDMSASLDSLLALGEFTYALLAEQRGQKMEEDEAFKARIAELDGDDVDQAFAIGMMTAWAVVAHPERYAPLTDEAARLRCLTQFTTNEVVRNEAADHIMQDFFLKVQMCQVNPDSPACRPLYEELRRTSTSGAFDVFVETQLLRIEHPELFDGGEDDGEE